MGSIHTMKYYSAFDREQAIDTRNNIDESQITSC